MRGVTGTREPFNQEVKESAFMLFLSFAVAICVDRPKGGAGPDQLRSFADEGRRPDTAVHQLFPCGHGHVRPVQEPEPGGHGDGRADLHLDGPAIPLGANWDGTIKKELEEANVVLCLVSTPFFASEYIRGVEMKRAMELHEQGKLKVIPVLLEDCPAWERSELRQLQGIVPDGKPVRFNDRRPADAFNVVERELAKMIREE